MEKNTKKWAEQLNQFFGELDDHVYSNAILTINGKGFGSTKVDILRKGDDSFYWGCGPIDMKNLFVSKILSHFSSIDNGGIVFVLRSFRDETHPKTHHPLKDIRVYILHHSPGNDLVMDKVPPENAMAGFSYDSQTGEPIEIEPELTFV